MSYEKNDRNQESIVYSKRLKAGKRRTYFFDVRATKGSDYYLIITESRKRYNEDGYDRHKIFLYKEDLNKFVKGLSEAVDYIKTELMPDYDFDAFNHDDVADDSVAQHKSATPAAPEVENVSASDKKETQSTIDNHSAEASSSDMQQASEEVDKW